MTAYPRGSEWRRWDLHLHTRTSGDDYKYQGDNAEELLVEELRRNEVAVVAITDHFNIEAQRILTLRALAPEITFFPGVELRTDKGGMNIHLILIFSEEKNVDELERRFKYNFYNLAKPSNHNFDNIYWDYNDIIKFAQDEDAIISLHAGGKSNGVDATIDNDTLFKQAVKEEYAQMAHFYDMSKIKDIDGYKNSVLKTIGPKGLIICSDNHDPRAYTTREKLWIKADPTFKGLKQVVNEPEDRIYVGECPPTLDRIYKNSSKTIDNLVIDWNNKYNGNNGKWFKNISLDFNPELVAIIGNKGNGKTAIAEIIALLSETKYSDKFVFLSKDAFRRKDLANNFDAQLTWHDKITDKKTLGSQTDETRLDKVYFVAQKSFDDYCNNSSASFIGEVNRVVFSRMPEHEKLGFTDFESLEKSSKATIKDESEVVDKKIFELNQKLMALENNRNINYKNSLKNKLQHLQNDYKSLEEIKPIPVFAPTDAVNDEYNLWRKNLEKINNQIKEYTECYNDSYAALKNFEQLKDKIDAYAKSHESFLHQNSELFASYELDLSNIVKVDINQSIIDGKYQELRGTLINHFTQLSGKPDENWNVVEKSLVIVEKELLEAKINEHNSKHSGKLNEYQKYLKDSEEWERRNIEETKAIGQLEKEIEEIGDFKTSVLAQKIESLREERLSLVKERFELLKKEIKVYDGFKNSITEFIEQYREQIAQYQIEINTSINVVSGFVNEFIEKYIHGNTGGNLAGSNGAKLIADLVGNCDFNEFHELELFLKSITQKYDDNIEENPYRKFKKNKDIAFLNDIFSLSFLKAEYSLELFGKPLKSLSPGERGSLLLVFYLLLDNRDIPLILDQPEDNLDNESVAKILVPFIKDAKKRRQVFIVTHNANLAVVADAEQIIRVKIDKLNDNVFTFQSGSLESEIISDVVDVLEGTKWSFIVRDKKYNL